MTRTEAEAIATAIERVRPADLPRWDRAGILAAIDRASQMGSPADILAALARLAGRADVRTPAMLAAPGPHWAGTTVADRRPPTMCGEHPTRRALGCPECAATVVGDAAAGVAAVRAAIRTAPRYADPDVVAARQAEHRRLAAERTAGWGESA